MRIPRTTEWVAGTRIDSSAWPALHVTFPSGTTSEDELRETLARLRRFMQLAQGGPKFVLIIELPSGMRAPPRHRMIAADWQASVDDSEVATLLCGVVVSRSTVVRGFVTAVTWLYPPKVELITVDSLEEGFVQARARLERDGTRVPPPLRARAS